MKKVTVTWKNAKGVLISQQMYLVPEDEKLYLRPEDGGVVTHLTPDALFRMGEQTGKTLVLFEDDDGIFGIEANDIVSIEEVK